MVHQIELGAADLHGTAITNFKKLMPPADSDMAEQTLKGEYDLRRGENVSPERSELRSRLNAGCAEVIPGLLESIRKATSARKAYGK